MESNETDSDLLITVHLLLVVDYRKYFAESGRWKSKINLN